VRIVGTGGCSMCGFYGRGVASWTAFVRSTFGEGSEIVMVEELGGFLGCVRR